MAGALLSFSMVGVGARELSGEIPVFETLFFRSLIGLLLLVPPLVILGKTSRLRSDRIGLHFTRNSFHFAGQYGWFIGIGLLPLAEVFALEFTVPVWTALIATLFLGEKLTWGKVVAVACGLLGVVIIVRPGVEIVDLASLVVLGAALGYAICHSATKAIAATEPAFNVLFYMFLMQMPMGLVFALGDWVWPAGLQWFWLFAVGLAAMAGHYCMASAMAHAEATTVVSLDFLRLPLIALVGMIFYHEPFDVFLILGGALMLLGNLVNARSRKAPTPESAVAQRPA